MTRLFNPQRRDLNLLALSLVIWSFGEGMFLIFQPIYLQELGADPVKIGLILSLGMAMIGLAHIPVGLITDRVSRKTLLLYNWSLGLVGALLMGLARNLTVYAAGLILYNVTGAVLAPMNTYIVGAKGDWSDNQAFTFISAAFLVGSLVGPVLGGKLAEQIGLGPLHLIAAGVFAVSTAIIYLLKEQAIPAREGKPSSLSILRNRKFMLACLLLFGVAISTSLPHPLSSNFLHNERGVSLQTLGIFASVLSLGGILFNLMLGKRQTWVIFLVGQAAVLGFSSLLLWGRSDLAFGMAHLLWGGYRVIQAITSSVVRPFLHKAQTGLGFGIAETARALALMLAPTLAGYLYDRKPDLVYIVAIGLGLVSFLALAWIGKKTTLLSVEAEA